MPYQQPQEPTTPTKTKPHDKFRDKPHDQAVASLTNDVLTLLARYKFPSYIKYEEVFLQPARLASHMLSTPQAQHYLFTLLDQNKHLSEVHDDEKLRPHRIHAPKSINDLTDADRQRVDTFLADLANLVTYSVRECAGDQDIGCCYKIDPRTVEETSTAPSTSPSGERTMTARSVIRISRSKLYDPLLQDQKPKDKLVRQFKVALTLLHEIAHAAVWAITARVKEYFFGDEIFAEAGYQLEVCLTGLVPLSEPQPESMEKTPLVVWRPWPCLSYLGDYDLDDLCSDRSKLEYHRGVDKVDSYYIKNLFSDSFWEVKVKNDGFKAVLARPIRHFKVASSMKSVQSLLAEKGVQTQQLIPQSMAPKERLLTSDQAERMLGLLGEVSHGVVVQAKQTGSVKKGSQST